MLSKSTSEWQCPEQCVDNDKDGYYAYNVASCTQGNDCDDSNAPIHPGALEICDGKDNNCDGQIDEGCCPKITSFTGSSTTINPSSGGAVSFSFATDRPYDSSEITVAGEKISGTTWNGKLGGHLVEPGTYPAALTVKKGQCADTKNLTVTVTRTEDCKLKITISSSANVASGNLSHSQELFSTRGMGLTTNLTLNYNSLDGYDGPLGKGWIHSYDIALKENSYGEIVLREGGGRRRLYTPNGGEYTSQLGDYTTLTKNTDGTFAITHKDGLKYNFRTDGKIASLTDRNGNTMSFTYTDGDLTAIKDFSGRVTSLSYDPVGRITGITDPNGNTYTLGYINNMFAYIIYPNRGRWDYTYDPAGFMLTKTDPNGYTTTYTYDVNKRVTTATDPEGKARAIAYPAIDDTSQTKTSTFTEKDGGIWTYTYNTQQGTLTRKTDPQGTTTIYSYDVKRNQISKTEPDGSITTYTYDSQGNMTSTTDPMTQMTTYTYNVYGQVTSVTDASGNTTTYKYDTSGNLTKTTDSTGATTQYQYDSKGNVTSVTNAAGQTTAFSYDQYGNLASIKDSAGATTSFTYDASGNMTSQTDASGNTTRFEYNSLNQPVKIIDPNGNSTSNTYDKNGNKISSTDANGNVTYYEYNYNGQLTKVKDALGNVTTYAYGDTGCSSCGGGVDKLTVITDANGTATKYEYDQLGRFVKETDPMGNAISYSYDSKGNLTSKTDANGATTSYSYDGLGRLLKKSYPDSTTESFTYDSKGNILTATNASTSYTFTYNTSGKVASVADSSGRTVSYQYDTLGNKTKLTYPEGSTATYTYDSANRLTKITNGGGKTYTFQYDNLGRRTKLSLPNGTSANYSYDTSGRLTSLVHKTSTGSVITQYSYTHDKIGNRLSKTNTDTKNDYSYDAIYRLLQSLPTKLPGKDITQENKAETFTYDPVGNRLSGPDSNDAYNYNTGNQLISDRKHQYEYDKNGNLIKKTETGDDGKSKDWRYSYDYENRLGRVVKQESEKTVTVTFKYDPFGRRLEKRVTTTPSPLAGEGGGEGETKTYNYVYDNEDIILEYLTKTEDSKTKAEATKYVHGPGIDEPLAIERKGEVYFYHADGLGSITALTDKKQKVVESYTYSAFGEIKRKGDKVKNTYTFTAREWDEEIGLLYVRARYLDPVTGRWTSYDPLLHPANGPPVKSSCGSSIIYPTFNALKSNPQKLNPYVYVENRPTILTDHFGLASCGSGWRMILVPDNWFGWYSFTGPCSAHDDCYGCDGARAGKTKGDCDSAFLREMQSVCSTLQPNSYWRNHCEGTAYLYYDYVVRNGQPYFDAARRGL